MVGEREGFREAGKRWKEERDVKMKFLVMIMNGGGQGKLREMI
jgi:hypothetical protein